MNKPLRKPRSDSPLKTLPADVQARIYDWSQDCSLEVLVQRCAADLQPPLKTNRSSLSEFLHWFEVERAREKTFESLKEMFQRADANAKAVGDMLRLSGSSVEQIAAAEQMVFTLQASQAGDREQFIELEKLRLAKESAATKARHKEAQLRQKDRDLELAGRRVALLEENASNAKAKLTEVISKGGLTPETLRQIEEAAKIL